MTRWTNEEPNKVGAAEELEIASLRRDGTLRNSTTIWMVRVGDDLYVRSVNGRGSVWFHGVEVRHEGHILAGGVEKDVTYMEEDGPEINDQVDTASRAKYRGYAASIIDSIVSPKARPATL